MPKPNDRISEYVLIEQVGTGTFGQVFKARHHVWPDQIVAIKIPTNPDYVRVLRREGSVMHKVSHPNVIRPMGFDPFADPPYLITEYIAGGDLRRLLSHGPLPVEQAVSIFDQVLQGLVAAHTAGVAHLDLKPSNILIAEDGTVKLTDFGLGRALMISEESLIQSLSLANEKASVAGTLEYMSPEQRRGQNVDERADLYSCGIILFEMLTGERPAGGEKPSDIRRDVPFYLDDIFTKCYARLEWRYESAQAVLDDLRAGPKEPEVEELPEPAGVHGPDSWGNVSRDDRNLAVDAIPVQPIAGVVAAERRCPSCDRDVRPEDQFCIHCGTQLTETVRRCARCGGYPQPHDRYCVLCGSTL